MTALFSTRQGQITGYAQVVLERGLDTGALTYAVPEVMADLEVGQRVMVPLGRANKPVAGYVTERLANTDLDEQKIKTILKHDPLLRVGLSLDLMELARWMAGYYCCPLGMVFAAMLPAAVKRGTGHVVRLWVGLSSRGEEVLAASRGETGAVKITKLQRAVLRSAMERKQAGEPFVQMKQLAHLGGARTVRPLKQLLEKGLLETRLHSEVCAAAMPFDHVPDHSVEPVQLSGDQQRAVDHLVASIGRGFSAHLLHGVTGSGKTEVYLRAIEHLGAGKGKDAAGAIVLVPEISLTPQTVSRFKQRFESVAVLHSGLTAAQRHEQWRRIHQGEARIVVGARSAVFAPLSRVGLLVVDEEHEASYKQDQLPRYNARDVAIKRAQLLSIPVLLGSATPSLESFHNASCRRSYHQLQLPQRVTGLKLPHVEIVDMTDQQRKRYQMTGRSGQHLLSLRLEMLLKQTVGAGGQVILLLNRRGYASYIACPDHGCGWIKYCDYCDVTMVYHKDAGLPAGGLVRCHHCGAEQLLAGKCPDCSKRLTVFGLGTQRVEEEIAGTCPGAAILRMDSDTMRTGRHYHEALEQFRCGQVQILVGTQMIAKGLDFPNVQLVGVISADTALHLPDFRASERTFGLIAQVAGRAGRGSKPGRVIVQSFNPADPAIVLAARHDYESFAARELELRREVGLPPITRMARIVVRDRDLVAAQQQATALAQHLRRFNEKFGRKVRLRGPAPCPIARIAEYYRLQIELIAADAATLQQLITALRNSRVLKSDARTAVDVDPVALL